MKSLKSILAKAIVTVSLIAGFTNAHAHSEAFKPEFVDTLVSPYLTIQEALAADKLTDARGGAQIFLTALKKGPSESDAPGIEELATSSGAIVASKNIADARSGFLALSKEMQPLIEHVGTTNKTDLFVSHRAMDNEEVGFIRGADVLDQRLHLLGKRQKAGTGVRDILRRDDCPTGCREFLNTRSVGLGRSFLQGSEEDLRTAARIRQLVGRKGLLNCKVRRNKRIDEFRLEGFRMRMCVRKARDEANGNDGFRQD